MYFSETTGSLISDLYTSQQLTARGVLSQAGAQHSVNDFGCVHFARSKTMFFASDRQNTGRRRLVDISLRTRNDSWNNWSTPINVEKPLNTSAEDDYFSMDNAMYLLWLVPIVDKTMANSTFCVGARDVHINLNGVVYDNKTKQIIGRLVSINAKDAKASSLKTDASKFTTRLAETNAYSVSAAATGYQPNSNSFTVGHLVAIQR